MPCQIFGLSALEDKKRIHQGNSRIQKFGVQIYSGAYKKLKSFTKAMY
jgi:hypothetical protein